MINIQPQAAQTQLQYLGQINIAPVQDFNAQLQSLNLQQQQYGSEYDQIQ